MSIALGFLAVKIPELVTGQNIGILFGLNFAVVVIGFPIWLNNREPSSVNSLLEIWKSFLKINLELVQLVTPFSLGYSIGMLILILSTNADITVQRLTLISIGLFLGIHVLISLLFFIEAAIALIIGKIK